jgi:adenylate kinase
MLKEEKLTYQEELEQYMEENDVYDVFETMMKNLIIDQPADPVPFLLDVLQAPEIKRVFIMGPPGSNRKEHALTIADTFEDMKFEVICVGDIISKEVIMRTDFSDRISESRKTSSHIDDDIVIELITKAILQLEKDKKSWIVEGFPRSRAQALSLTKMDFIPDHMILLKVDDKLTKMRVLERLGQEDAPVSDMDPSDVADMVTTEHNIHLQGVREIYSGRIAVVDGNMRQDIVLQEIARLLKLKKVNAPRTCPKILLIGSPGSGKTTQARMIAEKLKVIHIEVNSMVKDIINRGTDESKGLWKLIKDGEPIPDEVYEKLIKERLNQLDAKLNGFVLDGFPLTNDHLRYLMESCNIKPSHVIYLVIDDHKAYERLEYRKFDSVDGVYYDIYNNPPTDLEVLSRLIPAPEDQHHVVEKNIMNLRKNLDIEDSIIINADNDPETVFTDIMSEIGA